MNSSMVRRNKPGTRGADLYNWPPEEFKNIKGLFSVQEYIQELIRDNPENISKIIEAPKDIDIAVWKIEHLRQFILETNLLVVQLQGICTKQSCPKMKAIDDYIYACVHPPNNIVHECCAIDYMIHNLDQFTSTLNNSKYFPSRVTINSSAMKHVDSIVRRLYRIYSHTYYHHLEIFNDFEKEMHLCERFTEFMKKYQMINTKDLIIPSKGK